MAQAANTELIDAFEQFLREYYDTQVKQLAQRYPNEQRSLRIDWEDLYRFDPDLADDFLNQPEQLQETAEEALRLYDLPIDVSLGQAHVRVSNLPETQSPEIREIRARDMNQLVEVRGIVRKATDVRPKIEESAFECQVCGTLNRVPQSSGDFQEPHECQGCERQGPFQVNFDQSEFVDAQKLRIQESPEGLRGGETPQSLDVHVEDDITGEVTPGDHVSATGVLRLEQQGDGQEKSPIFDFYMEGMTVEVEEEQFEDMDITDDDKKRILEISNADDVYEQMVGSIAPSIYGYDQEKLAMTLQLFSGVTKHLPDGSRIRGDLHMLLIGDPGTGKCVAGDTRVSLEDGRQVTIRDLVESNLDSPKPIDDGWFDTVDIPVPSLQPDGSVGTQRATKVWKREAPDILYRVRTASGRELEVTPSHPLFVHRDGEITAVEAESLEPGTFIARPHTLQAVADDQLAVTFRRSESINAVSLELPESWTPSLARLLGYIVAEGYVEQRADNSGFVSITNNDAEVRADARHCFERLGLNVTERRASPGKPDKEIMCSAGEFVSFLAGLDEHLLLSSAEQRVPEQLFRVSIEVKRAFLKGYIEGEGHVSTSQRELCIASMSRQLLTDVQTLLCSLGIQSQIHDRKNGSYRLRISGADFETYIQDIGFVTHRKRDAARAHLGVESNTNRDVVPNVDELLKDLRTSLSLRQEDLGVPRSSYQHYERGSRNPSRDRLQSIVETMGQTNDHPSIATDGGAISSTVHHLESLASGDIAWDRIESITAIEPTEDWVYDLEVEGTHNYVSNGIFSHNSQMLGYIQNIAPRSVYTSGKGSSSAGLTAAAVRDDFGDGQQWTLEAGALVLADQGIAAVDELDKMRPEDRSAMHEALEQQKISVSKAGINATLKSRCSLLGAANPKYGRFDHYEPIGEQIDLEPALISRFDLIFTVTDQPDEEKDRDLADHILTTNYAGELTTQREQLTNMEVSEAEIEAMTDQVDPVIEAELFRKYVAYAIQSCHPRMTEAAREAIRDFYVDLRSKGTDEDAPIPVTARKLEALVRLSEASARVRLSDTVELADAERVIEIVRSCLQDIGVDPETGEFDADIVEAGRSKSQRDRIKNLKGLIADVEAEYDDGAPVDIVLDRAEEIGMDQSKAEHEIEKLKQKGEVYEPSTDSLRTT